MLKCIGWWACDLFHSSSSFVKRNTLLSAQLTFCKATLWNKCLNANVILWLCFDFTIRVLLPTPNFSKLTCQVNFKTVFLWGAKVWWNFPKKKKKIESEILAPECQHPGGLEKLQHQLFGLCMAGEKWQMLCCEVWKCIMETSELVPEKAAGWLRRRQSQTVWSGVDHSFAETQSASEASAQWGGWVAESLKKMGLDEPGAQLILPSALNPLNHSLDFNI